LQQPLLRAGWLRVGVRQIGGVSYFIRPCEVLGIMPGTKSTTTEGEEPLPPDTVY